METVAGHARGEDHQQHPIAIYLWIWALLFIFSTFSYLIDYFHLHGYLRWSLIITFMLLKAGFIVAVFMHMAWERLALEVKVAVAGKDNATHQTRDTTPAAPAAPAPAAVLSGEQVYSTTCVACHAAGVAGAPKFGDKGAWAPRLGQGLAVLHQHALEGFQGKSGVMPPKGGRVDLADKSILNAVEYMVNAAK